MNALKKYLGIVWMAVAIAIGFYTIQIFGNKLYSDKQEDLVFGIIVFCILLPMVVTGLTIFGWYAITNEYED
jgi:ABC-type spermidine/putrescine transport system permease subunit II